MLVTPALNQPAMADLGERIGPMIEQHWVTLCRAMLNGPDCTQQPEYVRILTGLPHPFGNFATVADSNDDESTAAAIEPLCTIAQPSALVFPAPPSEQSRRIAADAGFVHEENMPLMAVNIDDLAPTRLPDGYSFREVYVQDDAAWCEAFADGYGIPHAVGAYFGPRSGTRSPNPVAMHHFAVMQGDQFVCTSIVMLTDGLAGIYGVATLEEHRKRGLAAHATAEPLRLMRSHGYCTGILQASEMGEPVYRRLGFTDFGAMELLVRMPHAADSTG